MRAKRERESMFGMNILIPSVYHEPIRQLAKAEDRPIGNLVRRIVVEGIRERLEKTDRR